MVAAVNELGIKDDGLVVLEYQPGEPFRVPGRYSSVKTTQFCLSACNPEPRYRAPDSRRAKATSRSNFMKFLVNFLDRDLANDRIRLWRSASASTSPLYSSPDLRSL